MAWPTLLYDQDDLSIARTQPVDYKEYHPGNQRYGIAGLLRDYAGLPADEPLPWAMAHIITYDAPDPQHGLADTKLPVILTVTDTQAEILRPEVPVPVIPFGSTFWYLREVFHKRHPEVPRDAPRRGTLVFPDKSTLGMDTDFDRDQFARELASLPDEFHPVAVSVTWRDIERGSHLAYQQAGLMTVTSGYMFDEDFLLRLYDLCRQFKYSCANDISTSFCLSVLAGCRFFFRETGPVTQTRFGVTTTYERDPTLSLPGKRACVESSPYPPVGHGLDQRAVAERFAGKAFVRPPEFFRSLFADCRHRLQATPPPSVPDFGPGRKLDDLACWLAWGFDPNGWARERCGLVVPSRPGYEGICLDVQVPPRPDPAWRGTWSVTINGDRVYPQRVQAGTTRIELPCRKDGRAMPVSIRTESPVWLVNDQSRARTFRVRAIRWVERLSGPVGIHPQRWSASA